jgi:hypothetical protein
VVLSFLSHTHYIALHYTGAYFWDFVRHLYNRTRSLPTEFFFHPDWSGMPARPTAKSERTSKNADSALPRVGNRHVVFDHLWNWWNTFAMNTHQQGWVVCV